MNLDQFRAVLDLKSDAGGRTVLPVVDSTGQRIFGGQILAQLVAAAENGRTVKSLQVAFPRSGRPHDPLYLDLEKTHDGRSLGLRRVVAYQDQLLGGRRVVAVGSLLVDRADGEYDYQFDAADSSDPLTAKPIDFAVVPGESRLISDVGLDDVSAASAELSFWMRCPDFTDPALARPVLAYVSDWPVIGTLLKAVPGLSQDDAHVRLQTGVVSHSMWFHQPFDVSGWLRVHVRGQRLAGGRGFGTGAVYTQAGSLVASFAQESVIRNFR
ncbi:acyl-CoA thioesterase domain-containing protein [Mycobacterium sp. 050272]|uniref:acyl-CoA thioesterase n=1 Tax=Mycobacterium sp. 050272 TaxID=3142488 RepID=UPI003196EC9F